MDEALKKKVMMGVFVAVVGLLLFKWWPEGKADNVEWVDEPTAERVKTGPAFEVEKVEQQQRHAEVEEESDTGRRPKTAEIDEPIRHGSKKPTAKKVIAPPA